MSDPRYRCVADIELDSGTQYVSFPGIRVTGGSYYEPRLRSISPIRRYIPAFPGRPKIANTSVAIADPDGVWNNLKGTEAFRNRKVILRFGDTTVGLAAMPKVYTGRISGPWGSEGDAVVIPVRDVSFDRFETAALRSIDRETFPSLPDDQEPLAWTLAYGKIRHQEGAFPAILIDPALGQSKYRYFVTGHVCKSVVAVYHYGLLLDPSEYTVTTMTVDTITIQILEFASDMRDSTKRDRPEITVEVDGRTDDGLASGNLLTSPADAFKDWLLNETTTASAELNLTGFSNVASVMTDNGYEVGAVIFGRNSITQMEIIERWMQSFGMQMFANKNGLIDLDFFDLDELADLSTIPHLTDKLDIIRDTFKVEGGREVASKFRLSFKPIYLSSDSVFFDRAPEVSSAQNEADLGEAIKKQITLWYVQNQGVAEAVGTQLLRDQRENQQYATFTVPPGVDLDLGNYVRITYYRAPGAGGDWQDVICRVLELNLDCNPETGSIQARVQKVADQDRVNVSSFWRRYAKVTDEGVHADNWTTASEADKEFAYAGDDTDPTGSPEGTLGTSDPIKVAF